MPGKSCPNGHSMRELQSRCGKCGWQEGDGTDGSGPIPEPPRQCSFHGCQSPTSVVDVEMTDRSGDTYRFKPRMVFGKNLVPLPGFTFVAWVTRCCWHYMHELEKLGKDWRENMLKQAEGYTPTRKNASALASDAVRKVPRESEAPLDLAYVEEELQRYERRPAPAEAVEAARAELDARKSGQTA